MSRVTCHVSRVTCQVGTELFQRFNELLFGVQALKHQLIAANLDLSRVPTLDIHRRFGELGPQRLVPVL